MFTNIGSKIKSLATAFFWIGIAGSAVGGIALIAMGEEMAILAGILLIVGGCLGSWIGNFFIYGFGQLVENSDRMVQLMESRAGNAPKRERETPPARAPRQKHAPKPPKAEPQVLQPAEVEEIKCPHCGEELYVSEEETEGFACPYCGESIAESDLRKRL